MSPSRPTDSGRTHDGDFESPVDEASTSSCDENVPNTLGMGISCWSRAFIKAAAILLAHNGIFPSCPACRDAAGAQKKLAIPDGKFVFRCESCKQFFKGEEIAPMMGQYWDDIRDVQLNGSPAPDFWAPLPGESMTSLTVYHIGGKKTAKSPYVWTLVDPSAPVAVAPGRQPAPESSSMDVEPLITPVAAATSPLWVERAPQIIGNPEGNSMLTIPAATLHGLMAQIASLTEQVKTLTRLVMRQAPGTSLVANNHVSTHTNMPSTASVLPQKAVRAPHQPIRRVGPVAPATPQPAIVLSDEAIQAIEEGRPLPKKPAHFTRIHVKGLPAMTYPVFRAYIRQRLQLENRAVSSATYLPSIGTWDLLLDSRYMEVIENHMRTVLGPESVRAAPALAELDDKAVRRIVQDTRAPQAHEDHFQPGTVPLGRWKQLCYRAQAVRELQLRRERRVRPRTDRDASLLGTPASEAAGVQLAVLASSH
jgi:hypothetical protein